MKAINFPSQFFSSGRLKKLIFPVRFFIYAILVLYFFPYSIIAGPPFRTDDPEPVEYHHWEFYCASQITVTPNDFSGTLPEIEINYGIFPETQMHVIVPFSINHPFAGNSAYGQGDIELGLKYRFMKETSSTPQFGIFPLIELPAGNAEKGLGPGKTQVFFPLWFQKSWGKWTTYGGGGCLVTLMSDPANSWFIGWEGQHDFSEVFTAGAEVFSAIVPSESPENEVGFTIGVIVNLSDNHHFLFSAGRDIAGHNDLSLYAAYQLAIGQSSR